MSKPLSRADAFQKTPRSQETLTCWKLLEPPYGITGCFHDLPEDATLRITQDATPEMTEQPGPSVPQDLFLLGADRTETVGSRHRESSSRFECESQCRGKTTPDVRFNSGAGWSGLIDRCVQRHGRFPAAERCRFESQEESRLHCSSSSASSLAYIHSYIHRRQKKREQCTEGEAAQVAHSVANLSKRCRCIFLDTR